MKKISTLLFAFLAGSLLLNAGPVPREKALDVASKLLAPEMTQTKSGDLELKIIAQDDAFYIIEQEGGGFVIVAADDQVRPVLGFSLENNFRLDNMPDNVKWWLDHIRRECRAISAAKLTAEELADVRAKWDSYVDTKSALPSNKITDRHEEFFTVEWDQTDPANLLCPTVTGQGSRSICGCLPLALAMVMVHHGYPQSGTGTLPSYTYTAGNYKSYTVNGYALGTVYDWTSMRQLKTYSQFRNAKDPVRTNLAQLVLDCGVMVKADYNNSNYGGTGAYSNKVPSLMAKYMGYSSDAHIAYKNKYSKQAWNDLLTAEAKQRAFMFCGYSYGSWGNDAGHAYVVDGYATYDGTDRVFHFNFGWGGSCNGYYYADSQKVDSYTFDDDLECLLDLHPVSTIDYPEGTLVYESDGGISLDTGDATPEAGAEVTATVSGLRNAGATSFCGQAWVQVEDKNGKVLQKVVLKDFSTSPLYSGNSLKRTSVTFSLDAPARFGDRLRVVFQRPDEADILEVIHQESPAILAEWPLMPATFIDANAQYMVGESLIFKLKNCNYRYSNTSWNVTDPSGKTRNYSQGAGSVQLTAKGTYKIEAVTPTERISTYINVK